MAEQSGRRCLYDVLGVDLSVSPDEIRLAFRRLALERHPDKVAAANRGVVTPADTAAFQELRHAFEVLNNPNERAYYDHHRSDILFPDQFSEPFTDPFSRAFTDPFAGLSTPTKPRKSPFDVDLHPYFSDFAFAGFTDSGHGFYKVYGDLFAQLYANELKFRCNAISPPPPIGNLNTKSSQVKQFYNYWLSFSTVLSFAWVEEVDIEARKKVRKDYNELVRGLAEFVKQRDQRVIDKQAKKKVVEVQRREEKVRKEKEKEKGVKGEEMSCELCNRKFQLEMQLKEHEQSKKHKDKVAKRNIARIVSMD